MKIGVVTFWYTNENYGQMLQAYALQRFLNEKGHDAYLIKYDKAKSVQQLRPSIAKRLLGLDFKGVFKSIQKKLFYTSKSKASKQDSAKREFNKFRDTYLKFSDVLFTSYQEMQNNPPEADVYVCGSDQVWNYSFIGDPRPYFLQFGNDKVKRLSYAASFGHAILTAEMAREYKGYLDIFDGISVRESSGIDICARMGFKDVSLLPDPTFLLSKQAWNAIASNDRQFPQTTAKNFFIYTLGNRPSEATDRLLNYISDLDEVFILHSSINNDSAGNVFPTIHEWLKLISEADVVLTNSFHGMVFSIILNRNFIVLPSTGSTKGMNERMVSLLKKLSLSERLLMEFDEGFVQRLIEGKINWTDVNSIIEEWRKEAEEFLRMEKYFVNRKLATEQ
ncbi:MAG: polysaccharide pyruvyl transferase family protein [Chitinophagaceae bacterium]|nr:polysaccharide pyruvyl transferase family protein [Chitinophagaceae bacterium]